MRRDSREIDDGEQILAENSLWLDNRESVIVTEEKKIKVFPLFFSLKKVSDNFVISLIW